MNKIGQLNFINASARFELISANQQLLDFHLKTILKQKKLKPGEKATKSQPPTKKQRKATELDRSGPGGGPGIKPFGGEAEFAL